MDFALWFFLPAGIANLTPVVIAKIPVLSKWTTPLDFGRKFRGKPILGPNKTVRGLVLGSLVGTLVFALQVEAAKNFAWAANMSGSVDYTQLPLLLGFLLAFGSLFGDMVKSFAKRQVGVPSGKSWFPFDQLDYIIGGLAFGSFVIVLSLGQYLLITVVWFALHLASGYIGYLTKFKKDPI